MVIDYVYQYAVALPEPRTSYVLLWRKAGKATKRSISLLTYVMAKDVKRLGMTGFRVSKHDSLETATDVESHVLV